ncbi:MAG: 50S ribosomal protein L11 methyltransferase [Anaerolineae bacterium CG_4_9_14_3_um_filter_57_17]|nr:50S ribosomal protein L11 methyltransferase [bacterium]NCT20306.1 50S ribosomal protein L11 methyltransferase [bacterium]OIO84785.1 MAG: ribosomal protein L11 methyltransferase [Anaerolineae bacterium CG2_30_57_67]PJB64718.1 MAG: 50S ribosomal protein L11 methyltransferase [Anaerolineae bacterium CG_4_9_14_3_um_filter_57_17]
MTNWLEVSLTVNGELAEFVADVLARFAPNGVATEQAVKFNDEEDEGTPVGDVTVRAYLPADETLEETRQKLEEALYYLGMIQPLPAPTFTPIADQNWMEAWKTRYHPIPIGEKLLILPAWLENPTPDRLAIKIDPGMAFGTGTHPTTQLCLELLETVQIPAAVIDVGCGSGILSIGALKLGAQLALGVDIDPASVKNSRENADLNDIPAEKFLLGLGSVTEIKSGAFPLKTAPLVLANILAPVLVRLFEAGLVDLIAPGGVIILSGILQHLAADVRAAGENHGLTFVEQRQINDWVAIKMQNAEG